MNKVQQTQEELENHLSEQLHFLEISAENFDTSKNCLWINLMIESAKLNVLSELLKSSFYRIN